MNEVKQEQKGGLGSENTQIAVQNNNYGLTARDAMEMTLQLFRDNFPKLQQEAYEIVEKRINEFTETFFQKLAVSEFSNYQKFVDPAIQYTLFKAQKEYAKTGDEELKEYLISVLLERTKCESRNLKQIVLDEAINTLPKLTREQIDYLSLSLSLLKLNHANITSLDAFAEMVKNKLMMFFSENMKDDTFYSYLQITNCVSILPEGATYKPIDELLLNRYTGLFSKGFSIEEIKNELEESIEKYLPICTTCQQDKLKYQFNAMSLDVLENVITKNNLVEYRKKIISFYNKKTMTVEDVSKYLFGVDVNMSLLLNVWKKENSLIKALTLTPVGLAIAIINYNAKTGEKLLLDNFLL